jgi:hypothetical protein
MIISSGTIYSKDETENVEKSICIQKLGERMRGTYLLGLLAKIKCSICSYQLNLCTGGIATLQD